MIRTKTISLYQGSPKSKKNEICNYFLDSIELEESLFSLLKNEEAFYEQPNILRHPLIFYYGHTFSFYINKLYTGQFIKERVNPEIESLFAIGVDEMSWDDLNKIRYDWPSLSSLRAYREQVSDVVLNYINECDFTLPIQFNSPIWPILMGIEHHRVHLETSSVLIRQLDLKHITSNDQIWGPCKESGEAPENKLLKVSAGSVSFNKSEFNELYGWDNEYGTHESYLKSYSASQFLVSNSEYKKFIDSNGYRKREFWSDEGWSWKEYEKSSFPSFWVDREGAFELRTLDRQIPMPWNWPVEVNYLEAEAFCKWKSIEENKKIRMPTEDEWSLLHKQNTIPNCTEWKEAPGNINLEHYASSCPINKFKQGEFYDLIGNVWQWTETPIYPYEGFKVHPLYDDFSVPTFDGKHNLIKGGSWISTGNEANKESRYAFRRHFYQHAGFRYVHYENEVEVKKNPYETDLLLSQYCEFHYGDEYFNVTNFPKACIAQASTHFSTLPQHKKALDLGCALGRSSLELAKYFDHVIGLDFSARFVDKAQSFLKEGSLRYALPSEGDILDYYDRSLKELDCVQGESKIEFFQGDACNLSMKYSEFDLIFCGNLIDRLHSPKSFLQSIHKHLNQGGLLVLTSPYTWLEEYTPKSEWIGGYSRSGENIKTRMGLEEELKPWFDLVGGPDEIPFVIRETKRKFQHSISEMTVWKKRS